MTVLVLGGTGMAGHVIAISFQEAGFDVTVFSRKKIHFCKNIIGDITDFNILTKIINENNFDVIINAIGVLNQNAEESKATAVLINSYLPHFLSEITKNKNIKVIHMSTDCVFSGNIGNYSEHSFRDGKTFYDRSKALGEIDNSKDLTFRNSIVGPDMNINGIGLFNWFMKQEGRIKGYNKAIWTGVTTITLAKAMIFAINENLFGIYNLVNNEKISKFDLLKLFNNHMKENKINIIIDDEYIIDKSLVNTRKDFTFLVPSYEYMVIEMKNWIHRHKDLYPHYRIGEK
jgi:dTDP-4-dehydrorhamnose reductase